MRRPAPNSALAQYGKTGGISATNLPSTSVIGWTISNASLRASRLYRDKPSNKCRRLALVVTSKFRSFNKQQRRADTATISALQASPARYTLPALHFLVG